MKKIELILFLFFLSAGICFAADADENFDLKQNALALYNTGHLQQAKTLLDKIPDTQKDAETFLILANIQEDDGDDKNALQLLKTAAAKDPEFYKAYYNLGCLYMKKRIYNRAIENFELAVKYNKQNPYAYYNLGCAQMNEGYFKKAKKNFIKAIYIKNDEKNFYYNLAYANKKLGKQKDSEKIIDFYNQNFVK